MLDYGRNRILRFDQNLKSISSVSIISPLSIIYIIDSLNNTEIFISSLNAIYKLNTNLTIVSSYYSYKAQFTGIYYNQTGDYILACSFRDHLIVFLRRDDLLFLKYVSISPFSPRDIKEFNNTLFISTSNGTVVVLKNYQIISNFNTNCNFNMSLIFDCFGNLAVLCGQNIYLHSVNGSYLNITLVIPFDNATSMGFNALGQFTISSYNKIYFWN
jgi:hypothetical protein